MLAQGEVGRIPCAWMFSGASVKRGAGRYREGLVNLLFRFSNRMCNPSFFTCLEILCRGTGMGRLSSQPSLGRASFSQPLTLRWSEQLDWTCDGYPSTCERAVTEQCTWSESMQGRFFSALLIRWVATPDVCGGWVLGRLAITLLFFYPNQASRHCHGCEIDITISGAVVSSH